MLLKDQWKLFDDFVPDRLAAKLLALPDLLDALQRMAALSEHGVWIRLPESRRTEIGSRVDESRASMLADAVKHVRDTLLVPVAFQLTASPAQGSSVCLAIAVVLETVSKRAARPHHQYSPSRHDFNSFWPSACIGFRRAFGY